MGSGDEDRRKLAIIDSIRRGAHLESCGTGSVGRRRLGCARCGGHIKPGLMYITSSRNYLAAENHVCIAIPAVE